MDAQHARRQLLDDGYTVIPGILNQSAIDNLHELTDSLLERPDLLKCHRRTTGSMIDIVEEPKLSKLVLLPEALEAIRSLGFGELAWFSGYVISKPPRSPKLYWHQDWLFWNDSSSFDLAPHQIFAMYYLRDTTPENGCLRVIPGSHRHRHPLHDRIGQAHAPDAWDEAIEGDPRFSFVSGEVSVPVQAGDLLLGDARLLHAAHANDSMSRRTLITLWYCPAFTNLPEPIRSLISSTARKSIDRWPEAERSSLSGILPRYHGKADWQPILRTPGNDFI